MPENGTIYHRPLLPLAVALVLGITLGSGCPGYGLWALGVAAMGVVVLGRSHSRQVPSCFSPLILFLAFGYLLIQPWAAPRFPANHVTRFADDGVYQISGRVATPPVQYAHRQKFNLETDYVRKHNGQVPVTGRLRVTVSGAGPIAVGDRIIFQGYIRLLRNFNNPGGFDYQRYMAAQGVWASSYTRMDRCTVQAGDGCGGFASMIRKKRQTFTLFIEKIASQETAGILKALLLGDRRGLADEIRHTFQTIGIGHILAISGLHVGIVGGVVFFLAIRIMVLFPLFLWSGWTPKGAALVALIAVWGYGVLAGLSPATQRAVTMVSVFLLAVFIGKTHETLNTVAVAAMAVLVCRPPSLFSISFQLSFSAVIGIVLGLGIFDTERKQHYASDASNDSRLRVVGNKLIVFCLVSLFAILGTLPLVMFYFHRVSLIGLFSNLVFVPLIGFCVVPLGLLSLSILPVSEMIATGLLIPVDWVLSFALAWAQKSATWPFASIMTVAPSMWEIGCYYMTVLVLICLTVESKRPSKIVPPERAFSVRRKYPKQRMVLAVIILFFVWGADVLYWCYQRYWRQDLRVTVLDVGQGSANLLELPGGKTILIDGGGFSDNASFDVGKLIIAPFLLRKKIRTVDEIILSHPNSDHLNGLIYIAGHFNVNVLRHNNEETPTKGYYHLMETVRRSGIRVADFALAPRVQEINGVTFKYLYPPADYIMKKQTEKWRNTNNNSLVVSVRFGSHSFLFPGDIQKRAEDELVRIAGDRLKSTVLAAPHHGSRTSSTAAFLNRVRPQVVVFSAGWRNRHRFPHPEVRRRYEERTIRMYHTARDGAICFSTDGLKLRTCATLSSAMD